MTAPPGPLRLVERYKAAWRRINALPLRILTVEDLWQIERLREQPGGYDKFEGYWGCVVDESHMDDLEAFASQHEQSL